MVATEVKKFCIKTFRHFEICINSEIILVYEVPIWFVPLFFILAEEGILLRASKLNFRSVCNYILSVEHLHNLTRKKE